MEDKRYKLIKFAPKYVSVDKVSTALTISYKIPTVTVDRLYSVIDKQIRKKTDIKFSTFQHTIIHYIFSFKKKKER